MQAILGNGIRLEYEVHGTGNRETVLIITGLGGQIGVGPSYLGDELIARGFRVVAFDNRDSGLSSKFDEAPLPDWTAIGAAITEGRPVPVAYTLDDMARDAIGLMDALEISKAHVVGVSMGGMIAQIVAADFPARTASLTLAMTTSGAPDLPPPRPEVLSVMMQPQGGNTEAAIARKLEIFRVIAGSAFPPDEQALREQFARELARSDYPAGLARHQAAIAATGSRRERLRSITAPTVILHGTEDRIFPIEHGRDLAATIPGAELREVEGMGHDVPKELSPTLADAIAAAAGSRSTSRET